MIIANAGKKQLKAIKDALEDKNMPLSSYTLITKARLSQKDEMSITGWIDKNKIAFKIIRDEEF